MPEPWKILFSRALQQLEQGGVAKRDWVFGGGTVLTHKFNHRESKDIDIFFRDPQFLNFVSPRVNDGVEETLLNYTEATQHTRLQFDEGEIDFIVAPQISEMKPSYIRILDSYVYVEHPVEIIAKKIYYRAEEFKPRDVFDLAVVFLKKRDVVLKNASAFAEKLPALIQRIDALERSGELDKRLRQLAILSGGEKIHGNELELCKDFTASIEKKIAKCHAPDKNKGIER